MKQHGVRKLVFTSGLMVGEARGSLLQRMLLPIFRLLNRALYLDKVVAEKLVQESGLDWVQALGDDSLRHKSVELGYQPGSRASPSGQAATMTILVADAQSLVISL